MRGVFVFHPPCPIIISSYDYTGFSDASRASIQMTHSAFGPTVSMEEAQRIERETAEHLLKSKKLSLIVDLDQTIVHATVDPTVGEWITEGEAWEARQKKRSSTTPKEDDSDSSDDETSEEDVCNPNWDALKDVRKFRLGPESFGLPPSRAASNVKGKHKAIESEGCMYYIKPRWVVNLHSRARAPTHVSAQARPTGLPSQTVHKIRDACIYHGYSRICGRGLCRHRFQWENIRWSHPEQR